MISNFKSRGRGFTVLEALCMMVAVVLLGWLTLALVKNHFKPSAEAAKPGPKPVPAAGSSSAPAPDTTPAVPTSRAGSDTPAPAPAPAAPNP
jgi:hypothetical protein